MRNFAKASGGKLLSDQFLGRNHPYKWRCSEKHIFYAVFWELKEQEIVNILYYWVTSFDTDYTTSVPGRRSEVIFYKKN